MLAAAINTDEPPIHPLFDEASAYRRAGRLSVFGADRGVGSVIEHFADRAIDAWPSVENEPCSAGSPANAGAPCALADHKLPPEAALGSYVGNAPPYLLVVDLSRNPAKP
jgi:hypothetical protein